ncbi:PH domain-containing protein [Streptomyces sp. NPDC012756]|uniref:PH domain-containing protein n=1 Tax=Streptomyces sp. NPDC012756 TaxID=3364847 RepID=UPI0036A1DE98
MGVRIDSTGLTARGLGRSKVVPWCVIGAVDTGDGPGLAPVQAPGLVLKNGEQVGLGSLVSYSSRTVDADFALIKSLHATHVTDCPNCCGRGVVPPAPRRSRVPEGCLVTTAPCSGTAPLPVRVRVDCPTSQDQRQSP